MIFQNAKAAEAYQTIADKLGEELWEATARIDALPANEHFRTSIHGADHSKRVLLYALVIANAMGLPAADRATLSTAAVYHDTQRQDDWLDTGHGARAAQAYLSMVKATGDVPDELAALIMQYHDLDDEIGKGAIAEAHGERGVRLFQVFKDADGLDRFRLGGAGPDPSYLRTEEALALLDTARVISGSEQEFRHD